MRGAPASPTAWPATRMRRPSSRSRSAARSSRSSQRSVIAVTGGLAATIGGRVATRGAGIRVAAGTTVRLEPSAGARGYLAVNGGVRVEPVMGSASTDLRTGFGGHEGRALRAGDRLAIGPAAGPPGTLERRPQRRPDQDRRRPAPRVLAGRPGRCRVDRWPRGRPRRGSAGRPPLDGSSAIASMGLPIGAIQVPPDGRPIVMLVDRPVTGGYPVPACVIRADVGRVAQLVAGRPGCGSRSSRPRRRARPGARPSGMLSSVEPIDTDGELGWAGSHG